MSAPAFAPIPSIGVEITNRCNLTCRHCFNHSGEGSVQELSLTDLQDIFSQMQAMGCTSVRISGGEPTLHPEFPAILEEAAHHGLKVSINSHGIYPPRTRQVLADHPVEHIIISLDGLCQANDQIRGGGNFDRALESVAWLRSLGRAVTLGIHLRYSNRDDISGLIELAVDLGCSIKFSPLRPLGRAGELLSDEILTPLDFYHAVETITQLRTGLDMIKVLTDYDILIPLEATPPASAERSCCPAGRSFLNINYDGHVYPCAFLVTPQRTFSAGHIHDARLLSLWESSPVFIPFRSIEKDAQCQDCPAYRRTCTGGCVAISYFTGGRIDAHDPTCFIKHVPPEVFASQTELRR